MANRRRRQWQMHIKIRGYEIWSAGKFSKTRHPFQNGECIRRWWSLEKLCYIKERSTLITFSQNRTIFCQPTGDTHSFRTKSRHFKSQHMVGQLTAKSTSIIPANNVANQSPRRRFNSIIEMIMVIEYNGHWFTLSLPVVSSSTAIVALTTNCQTKQLQTE